MLDGLQALLTRQRSFFLVFLFLSLAVHLLPRPSPPRTFERPFARARASTARSLAFFAKETAEVRSVPAARYFLSVTSVFRTGKKDRRGISDRGKNHVDPLFSLFLSHSLSPASSLTRFELPRCARPASLHFLDRLYARVLSIRFFSIRLRNKTESIESRIVRC